jgi:lysozyme
MSSRNRIVTGTAVAALAVAFVGSYEGLRTKSYRDIIGVPTICYGETRGVKMGETASKEECDAMLIKGLQEFERDVTGCVTRYLPNARLVAFTSLAYNIGSRNFCRSTLVKKYNDGDVKGACAEFKRWNRAGGKVVKGLTRRRAAEQELCEREA